MIIKKINKIVGSHDRDDRLAHLWEKTLKIFSRTNILTDGLENWYVALGTRILPRIIIFG